MDLLSSGLIGGLTAKLAPKLLEKVIGELPGWLRRRIDADPAQRTALQKAFQAGLAASLGTLRPPDPDYAAHYSTLIEEFFESTEVAVELAKLVDIRNIGASDPAAVVDITSLVERFRQEHPIGTDDEAELGFNTNEVVKAFAYAYSEAIKSQADRLPWINTGYLDQIVRQLEPITGMAADVAAIRAHIDAESTSTVEQMGLRAYLDWVRRQHRFLLLQGIDANSGDTNPGEQRIELSRIYIEPTVTAATSTDPTDANAGPPTGSALSMLAWEFAHRGSAVTRQPGVLVLGEPGSGKSTLIGYLALCLALERLEPGIGWLRHLPGWPPDPKIAIPIRFVLRDFAKSLDGQPQAEPRLLWRFLLGQLERENLAASVPALERALEEGAVVLLFDGLDEVGSTRAREILDGAVRTFLQRYPKCFAVITCRDAFYRRVFARSGAMPVARTVRILPFDSEQIIDFIKLWYSELERVGVLTEASCDRLAIGLSDALNRSDLQSLGGNPLLLTVMALVHTHRGRLPESRAVLYEEAVDLLFSRWEEVKDAGGTVSPLMQLLRTAGLSEMDAKRAFWKLAFEVHDRGAPNAKDTVAGDIQEHQLLALLRTTYPAGSGIWAQEFVDHIRDRVGLLVETEPGVFRFPHLTFQEYLAGAYLSNLPNFASAAASMVLSEKWDPVVRLAIGRLIHVSGDLERALGLIAELCPVRDLQPNAAKVTRAAALLVLELGVNRAQALELGSVVVDRVAERLSEILSLQPGPDAEIGKLLTSLGDRRTGLGLDRTGSIPIMLWCAVPEGAFISGTGEDDAKDLDHMLRAAAHWLDPSWEKNFASYGGIAVVASVPATERHTEAFLISRFPVTQAQFAAFVAADGYGKRQYWEEAISAHCWSDGRVRVTRSVRSDTSWASADRGIGVADSETWSNGEGRSAHGNQAQLATWFEAVAFCIWLNEQLKQTACTIKVWTRGDVEYDLWADSGSEVRLPTADEWEKASRGVEGNSYVWGNNPRVLLEWSPRNRQVLGLEPSAASPFGLLDAASLGPEWVSSTRHSKPAGVEAGGAGAGAIIIGTSRAHRPAFRWPYDRLTLLPFRVAIGPKP